VKTLASLIGATRKRLGLQVNQLAERVNVDETYITHIEKGNRIPSLEILLHIEKVLGVDCQTAYFRERHPTLKGYRLIYGRVGKGKSNLYHIK
jgi:transcriptional regulator with XRE-family HTH domain